MQTKLTDNAHKLFMAYWKDRGNWQGAPLVGANVMILGKREDCGLLTACKVAGLLYTDIDDFDGTEWVQFTPAGEAYAAAHG